MNEQAVGVQTHAWGPAESEQSNRNRIFFLASRGAVFQGLFQAVRHHFHGFEVTLVDQLPASEEPDEKVRLALLSPSGVWNSVAYVRECHRRFPAASIGLIVDDATQAAIDFEPLLDHRLVHGLLPLNLPLDVWLAVMSLLISGGQYLPFETTRRDRPATEPAALVPRKRFERSLPEPHNLTALKEAQASHAPGNTRHSPALDTLTARERQILQLVSEGYQNKLIADRMSLSEHTVKAHVHNLIAKLRVNNRTQAAATFLALQDPGRAGRGADTGTMQHTSHVHGSYR